MQQLVVQGANRAQLKVAFEDERHDGGILFDHGKAAPIGSVADGRRSSHPHAALLRGCDLVADAPGGDLALELGKRQQHVEGQPARAGGGVERLGDGDEADPGLVGGFDELGEVEQASGQAINLVDDHIVDETCRDVEIARLRAVREAARPTLTVAYESATASRVTIGGVTLVDGEELGYDGHAELVAPGVGTITLRSNAAGQDDGRLDAAEAQRGTLIASMGVADLAAARAQQVRAQGIEAKANEARAQLAVLAPDGLDVLRAAVAAQAEVDPAPIEMKANAEQTRIERDLAEQRRQQATQTIRASEPARDRANEALVEAETALARLQTRDQNAAAILGIPAGREQRRLELMTRLTERDAALADAQRAVDEQRTDALGFDAVDAALRRVRSVEQAADTEMQQLRETIAGQNARIAARSGDAVEENWQEAVEALASAEAKVAAFGREVAVLTRLTQALDTARSNARELYLTPVMNELRPLLGLLFDDVAITFDEDRLLPQTIVRAGQEEDVDRLSGGMREQLSVLTRLAFARLLASAGRPAPVILDDALVYSDDDRIERMFDALHRQAREQQISVFSCRQRAFQRLGGNLLQMIDWQP